MTSVSCEGHPPSAPGWTAPLLEPPLLEPPLLLLEVPLLLGVPLLDVPLLLGVPLLDVPLELGLPLELPLSLASSVSLGGGVVELLLLHAAAADRPASVRIETRPARELKARFMMRFSRCRKVELPQDFPAAPKPQTPEGWYPYLNPWAMESRGPPGS
jgi:hypothetical protein